MLSIDNIIPKNKNHIYSIEFQDKDIQSSKSSIYSFSKLFNFRIINRTTIQCQFKGGLIVLMYQLQKLSFNHPSINIIVKA